MFETLLGIISTAVIGSIGWLFVSHTEVKSSVSVLKQRDEDYTTIMNAQFNSVNQRLDRIERAMNGALKGH